MAQGARDLHFLPLRTLPLVGQGDDLAELIAAAAGREGTPLADGDIVIVAQKLVSRAAGLFVDPAALHSGPEAEALAAVTGKPAAVIEAILAESRAVVVYGPQVIITEHLSGCVMANAGLDQSNLPAGAFAGALLAIPRDPDAAAHELRAALWRCTDRRVAVIICDSWGRPFRLGTVGFALGVAGMPAIVDLRGEPDLNGRLLQNSMEAIADGFAAAANLFMGQGAEGVPVVIARGYDFENEDGAAADLLRARNEDLFR